MAARPPDLAHPRRTHRLPADLVGNDGLPGRESVQPQDRKVGGFPQLQLPAHRRRHLLEDDSADHRMVPRNGLDTARSRIPSGAPARHQGARRRAPAHADRHPGVHHAGGDGPHLALHVRTGHRRPELPPRGGWLQRLPLAHEHRHRAHRSDDRRHMAVDALRHPDPPRGHARDLARSAGSVPPGPGSVAGTTSVASSSP